MSEERQEQGRKKRKLSEIIKENLQKIIIILISIVYITQGLFKLKQKEATILEILGSIGLSIIVGFVISSNLRTMGIRDGRRSEIFVNSTMSYAKSKRDATPYFDKLSPWCEYKNTQDLEFKRKGIVQGAGLNWKAFKFGYYDDPINIEKLNQKQINALEQAKNCTIYRISSQEILSDLPGITSKNGNRFGTSQQEYLFTHNVMDVLSRILIGVVCGLYGLYPLMTEGNWREVLAGVIWNTLQIIIFIAFGLVKYSQSRSFIEDDYRQTHIVQKTELLNEFVVTMQNNPSVIDNYDEEVEMEKYIEEYIEKKNKLKELEQQSETVKEM